MRNLTVITYSSMGEDVAFKLKASCEKFNYNLEFIGKDEWFRDFRQIKIDLILKVLKNIHTKYVCYTDAPDSWFLRGDILSVYKKNFPMNQIVVSGNRDHYPETTLYDFKDTDFPQDSSFRFICSSQFIGTTKELINFFEVMQREYQGTVDQEGWHYLFAKKLYPFEIDSRCKLFLNMTNVNIDELGIGFFLKETGVIPCAIHFGGAKGESPNGLAMIKAWEIFQSS